MKRSLCSAFLITSAAAFAFSVTARATREKAPPALVVIDAPTARGSIRPRGNLKATERLALAKISFADAEKIAAKAVPGKMTYGELEVEDGNLQFDFEIITVAGKVMDVAIDAGDGRVLGVDVGDNE